MYHAVSSKELSAPMKERGAVGVGSSPIPPFAPTPATAIAAADASVEPLLAPPKPGGSATGGAVTGVPDDALAAIELPYLPQGVEQRSTNGVER